MHLNPPVTVGDVDLKIYGIRVRPQRIVDAITKRYSLLSRV
jgi:hypothetical protein